MGKWIIATMTGF